MLPTDKLSLSQLLLQDKNKEKQKLCQVLCVCGAEYNMCSDIRSHAYTTAVWIKKIGQHIADFHMWIIYPHRQENTRNAQNWIQVAGFGRGTWAWACLLLIVFEQKQSRWKIHSRWMSMVTVASLPLGDALLEARQVICWPLSMFEAEMWSVLTVLSLLPSRNSVCVKTQICHGAAFCRWSMIFTEKSIKNKLNNSRRLSLNFLLSVGQKQIADSQSASLSWKSQSKPSTQQPLSLEYHMNMKCLFCYQTSSVLRNLSLEVTHFVCQSQSSLFTTILPALLRSGISSYCRGTVFIEERLLKNWYRYLKDIDFI